MEPIIIRLAAVLVGYLLGNIQTAYVVAKRLRGVDIREYGSGNSGTTNVTRLLGLKIGVGVFCVDALKTILAFVIAESLLGPIAPGMAGMYAGAGVVLGHNFPFHMRFRGGKGAASTIGLMLCTDWRVILIQIAVGLAGVSSTRMVSVGSLAITASFPVMLLLFGYNIEIVGIGVFLWALAWYMHRGNIQRILAGTERRIGSKKSA